MNHATLFSMVLVFINTFSIPALAGFPPLQVCSNLGNTIHLEISDGRMSVLVEKQPMERIVWFPLGDVAIVETTLNTAPEEISGCTSRIIELKTIQIARKDGASMPDAYNRLARNGVLTDYFVCKFEEAWMPAPGHDCK